MHSPAIVIIAYNRPASLRRLLKSLDKAKIADGTCLHISIDASEVKEVEHIAQNYEWKYGEKNVDVMPEHLGLKRHILRCGDLTEMYGTIIMLEDDLLIAPGFYQYAQQASSFYTSDDKIAGISLFTYSVEENNFNPFQPIQDDSDVHFIQVASSWGQCWNKDQWSKFKSWLIENQRGKESLLPEYILNWGNNSWKKLFINYLIDTDRYFAFPNTSYSTNFEEEGTHASRTGLFQAPLNMGITKPRLNRLEDSNSIYDVYFELQSISLKKLCPALNEFDFELDIFGNKPISSITSEYLLTSRRGMNAVKLFGSEMKPLLQNVLFEIEGDDIGLYRLEDLLPTEKNRYLNLYSGPVRLDKHSEVRRQKNEQVTVVIPILDHQLEDLKLTIQTIESDRFYNFTLLIVCSPGIKQVVEKLVTSVPAEIEIVGYETEILDELLRVGIAHCSTDYCSWIQPGMILDAKRMEDVARIFQGMLQVQILHGLSQEVTECSYGKLKTAKNRWTPHRANLVPNEAGNVRTELIFWRNSLISDDVLSKLTSANLFIEFLKLNPIYTVALKLGDFQGTSAVLSLSSDEVKKSLSASDFQPKGGFRSITRPIFYYWFRRNTLFFRLFYTETELQLPMVIRYDFKHDSFYLDNY